MNPEDITRYRQAILNAQAALKRRELFEAGQWALSASNIAPDREEPWLLLAAGSLVLLVFYRWRYRAAHVRGR